VCVWCVVCVCGVCGGGVCVCVCVCVISILVSEVVVNCALLGHYVTSSVNFFSTFRDIILVPYSRQGIQIGSM